MQKVVIDTNVIVSSLIQNSYPFLIIKELVLENKIKVCLSEELFKEYHEVLNRPKFSKYPQFLVKAELVLVDLIEKSTLYKPKNKLNIISDLDDNKILELAEESNANYIITGNSNDFTFPKFKNTKIVSPKEFWELFQKMK